MRTLRVVVGDGEAKGSPPSLLEAKEVSPALAFLKLLRRLIECVTHPIRKRLAVFLGNPLPRFSFRVEASEGVRGVEFFGMLRWPTSPITLSAARHRVHDLHTPEVYPKYFEFARRFHLILSCVMRIVQ